MRIRIEAFDLPGLTCGPGPDHPDGHFNIHVALQGRKGQQDLHGLVQADVPSASWELECSVTSIDGVVDFRSALICGSPAHRFIYLSWGVVSASGEFTMFRRAKIWFDTVPFVVLAAAEKSGVLIGRLGLTDDHGWPVCASVRPPRIEWSHSFDASGLTDIS